MISKFNNPLSFPIMKKVYYPGSGNDIETLKLILSEFKFVEDIVFTQGSKEYVGNVKNDI